MLFKSSLGAMLGAVLLHSLFSLGHTYVDVPFTGYSGSQTTVRFTDDQFNTFLRTVVCPEYMVRFNISLNSSNTIVFDCVNLKEATSDGFPFSGCDTFNFDFVGNIIYWTSCKLTIPTPSEANNMYCKQLYSTPESLCSLRTVSAYLGPFHTLDMYTQNSVTYVRYCSYPDSGNGNNGGGNTPAPRPTDNVNNGNQGVSTGTPKPNTVTPRPNTVTPRPTQNVNTQAPNPTANVNTQAPKPTNDVGGGNTNNVNNIPLTTAGNTQKETSHSPAVSTETPSNVSKIETMGQQKGSDYTTVIIVAVIGVVAVGAAVAAVAAVIIIRAWRGKKMKSSSPSNHGDIINGPSDRRERETQQHFTSVYTEESVDTGTDPYSATRPQTQRPMPQNYVNVISFEDGILNGHGPTPAGSAILNVTYDDDPAYNSVNEPVSVYSSTQENASHLRNPSGAALNSKEAQRLKQPPALPLKPTFKTAADSAKESQRSKQPPAVPLKPTFKTANDSAKESQRPKQPPAVPLKPTFKTATDSAKEAQRPKQPPALPLKPKFKPATDFASNGEGNSRTPATADRYAGFGVENGPAVYATINKSGTTNA